MKYVMLVYQDERQAKAASDEQMAASVERFMAFQEAHADEILDGTRLRHSDTATTVRLRDDQILTIDGPYAETKEQLGGFYLVEAKDLDEAIQIAAAIPTAEAGSIEVRPVYVDES